MNEARKKPLFFGVAFVQNHFNMSNQINRDYKRRQLVARNELKRLQYKAISQDINLIPRIRLEAAFCLNKLNRNSALVRVRNRCVMTGRARSVYSKYKMSRIVFRELASKGSLTGVTKSSW
jgi:ribosomal protein S14